MTGAADAIIMPTQIKKSVKGMATSIVGAINGQPMDYVVSVMVLTNRLWQK